MAVTLNASSTAGFVTTADTSTILQLQTNGTTAVTVDDSQRVAFVAGTAALPAITTTGDTNTGIFFPAADTIAFSEGGVEAMRLNSAGNLQTIGTISVGNATPSTSGAGITFPAAQSASSNANTLDDYEEGTWTPTDGSGAGLIFTVNSATYAKVGKLVFVNMYLTYPTTASSASAVIAGLPFTAQTLGFSYLSGRVQNNIGNGAVWQVTQSDTVMASNPATNSGFAYTNANYSGSFILFSGCYVSAN